jgi:hypothetical protein
MPIGQELLNVPMGEMIYSMASSIAKSQIELDRASIEVAEMMGGLKTVFDDQGNVRFQDSRVFFGHENMTIAEAMVLQGNENPMVAALAADQSFSYTKYELPADAATVDASLNTNPVGPVTLSAASLNTYQQIAKRIRDRIAFVESKKAAALAANAPVALINSILLGLKELDKNNSIAVAGIFQRQIQIPTRVSLLELGFTPTFYQFIDTIIEVKIAITITQETSSQVNTQTDTKTNAVGIGFKFTPFGKGKASYSRSVQTAQVNATYGSKYSHTAEGSSLLRTKLTPLPPPAVLEERIRGMMAADQARRAAELGLLTAAAGTA